MPGPDLPMDIGEMPLPETPPRTGIHTPPEAELPETPGKRARIASMVAKSGQTNVDVNEEDIDMTVLNEEIKQQFRGGEFLHLRTNKSYGMLPRSEMKKNMKQNPKAKKLTAR